MLSNVYVYILFQALHSCLRQMQCVYQFAHVPVFSTITNRTHPMVFEKEWLTLIALRITMETTISFPNSLQS